MSLGTWGILRVRAEVQTMSDKRKKAYRARQKAKKVRYTTARMNVRRDGDDDSRKGSVSAIVEATIALAIAERHRHEQQHATQAGGERFRRVSDFAEELEDFLKSPLLLHLRGLSPDNLRKVEVLMYAGRDEEDILQLSSRLSRNDHADTASNVAQKYPLADYLRRGLQLADEQGLDLDGSWPPAAPRTDDEDDHEELWVEEARERLALAFRYLEFDEERGTVTVGMDDPRDGGIMPEEFANFEDLRQALVELADTELAAYAPFEDGEPVFDLDGSDMVDEMLEEHGVTAFFDQE